MIFASDPSNFEIAAVAAVVFVIGMILAYRLIKRDPNISKSRYGFFVERDKFDDPPQDGDPSDEETGFNWPKRPEP